DAWGKNSSFQLAAIHALARDLQETGEWLGHDADPLVQELQAHLPEITLLNNAGGQEIALWEGQALDPGHRHHSHLAGIGVFGTVDPEEERYREIVQNSDSRWTMSGTGSWVGWSFPWAAQIKTRMGNPAAAQLMLHLWQDGFTSRTGISFIGAMYQGVTMGGRWWFGKNEDGSPRRLMQMDGEMACINAVSDLFAYCDRDVMYFFRGIRSDRQDASFRNVPLPFGVTASGAMRGGRAKVHLTASRDVQLKISLPGSPVREISLKAGEKYTF
ncbi:MAG: hypothetical protein J6R85_06215, partial [Lentisphaeria bacterium]|nr:hypothetical protein [Lentisphaeria bacterium]